MFEDNASICIKIESECKTGILKYFRSKYGKTFQYGLVEAGIKISVIECIIFLIRGNLC